MHVTINHVHILESGGKGKNRILLIFKDKNKENSIRYFEIIILDYSD